VAITTTLATRYWLKTIIMAVVCLVLGVWGIWDYTVAIPKAIQEADRAEFLRETIQPALKVLEMGSEERDRATVKLNVTIEEDDGLDKNWSAALIEFKGALDGSGGSQQKADDLLGEYLNKYGSVTRPSKFDRPMQWLFILCLPLGFYYLWAYFKLAKRANAYRLDDDGTLTTPEGTWSAEEIKDIDMGRWIAKTGKARTTWTAKVIVENHSPILLDDYIYKDMHLIIGKLAHGFYPESWTPLARRARVDKIEESEVLGEEE
jgi:hypothetical protein